MPDTPLQVRVVDSTGRHQSPVAHSLTPVDDEDGLALPALVEAASALIGVPVAILGTVDDVLWAEALDPGGLAWVDGELPEGWSDRAPWRQPGWYAGAVATIDSALATVGRRRTGAARQAKHWGISALLQVPTDAGDVWFKQVPPLFAHEGALVTWLSDLDPQLVPAPLAVGRDWWIAHDLGAAVEVPPGQEIGALEVLTQLQQLAVGRDADLLALGCPDRRLLPLLAEVEALMGRDDLLTVDQRAALGAALPALGEHAKALDDLALPATLVHGDFHSGNVRFTEAGWVVYDWTDGCLGHPFIDLVPEGLADGQVVGERWRRTLQLWDAGQAESAGPSAVVVGAAHQLVTYQRLADGTEPTSAGMWLSACGGWADRLLAQLSRG